ncbi:MAG: ATP phosphoribosyltransferase regulatory subunit [Oscillospiraceae bacterium]|nr:ATP phosphoribosyltransferase regulatory subunit [Oscillospiraceae bacterium]
MPISEDVLKSSELAVIRLRALYSRYGYTRFEMNNFEEYELYARNKSFLVSDDVITFTGYGGKLMALRPDVTLSIVKNSSDDRHRKLYYNENVYRATADRDFRERMQMGVECVGDVGAYEVGETLYLAGASLAEVGENYCLDVSHLGFLSGLIDAAGFTGDAREVVLRLIGEKNAPELRRVCAERGVSADLTARLASLAKLYGEFDETVGELELISVNAETDAAIAELRAAHAVVKTLGGAGFRLDFSAMNDLRYYNGIIFRGYVEGVHTAVLSGGQYDNLMRSFGKRSGAIGFAVFLDLLGELHTQRRAVSDVLLIFGDSDGDEVARAVRELTDAGYSVRAQREIRGDESTAKVAHIKNGRVKFDD